MESSRVVVGWILDISDVLFQPPREKTWFVGAPEPLRTAVATWLFHWAVEIFRLLPLFQAIRYQGMEWHYWRERSWMKRMSVVCLEGRLGILLLRNYIVWPDSDGNYISYTLHTYTFMPAYRATDYSNQISLSYDHGWFVINAKTWSSIHQFWMLWGAICPNLAEII